MLEALRVERGARIGADLERDVSSERCVRTDMFTWMKRNRAWVKKKEKKTYRKNQSSSRNFPKLLETLKNLFFLNSNLHVIFGHLYPHYRRLFRCLSLSKPIISCLHVALLGLFSSYLRIL